MSTKGRNDELKKNTIIIAFGQICTKFLWLILLPIYTQLINPEEYGIYDLYSTYWMLLGFIIFVQIDQALFRFLIDERGKVEGQCAVFTTSFIICVVNSVIFISIFMVVSCIFDIDYQYFLLGITIVTAWCGFFQQFSRGLGDNKTYAVSGMISAVVQISLNVVLVFYFRIGIVGLFWAFLAGNAACLLFVVFKKKVWQYCHLKYFNKRIAKSLVLYSLPLIPNQISWWVVYASDRTITAVAFGAVANGLLAIASKYSTVLSTAYAVFHLAWVESASTHIDDNDNKTYFEKVINTATRGFFALFIVFLPAYSIAFPYIIDSSYYDSYGLFPLYLGAAMFNVVQGLYSVIYIAKKKTAALAKSTIMSALVNVIVYVALIKPIGLMAAGVSTIVAYAIFTIWRYFDVKKYMNVDLEPKALISMLGLSSIAMVAYYVENMTLNVVVLIVACVYSIISNRQIIRNTLGKLRSGNRSS